MLTIRRINLKWSRVNLIGNIHLDLMKIKWLIWIVCARARARVCVCVCVCERERKNLVVKTFNSIFINYVQYNEF